MIKKIYLTRTETRAMSVDHPIGDPTGGPAFGEKKDPISAAISIGTMFTVAEAGFAAMTLMQGITFAGAALSLVGNVTGNKSLMKIGAIAGIAGGLGSLAESAGWFSSGNLSETLGMGAKDAASTLTSTPAGSLTPVQDGVQIGGPMVDGPNLSVTTDAAGNATRSLGVDASTVNTAGASGINAGPNNLLAPATEAIAPAVAAPSSELLNSTSTALSPGANASKDILGRSMPQMSYAPGMGPNTSLAPRPGFFDSLKAGNYTDAAKAAGSNAMDMLKNNPTGAYVVAQAIGGVTDWLSGKTDAELDALKANTGYANAKALEVQAALDREKLRRANLNAGYTNVNAGFKVNPNAAVTQPWQQPGLVAGAMQQRPA
jgi:hypothetical protein